MPKPTGRVIEGVVDAQASPARVELNRDAEAVPAEAVPADGALSPLPPACYYREVQHNRVTPVRQGADVVLTMVSLFERVPERGEWLESLARFQGLGIIEAQTPMGPVKRNYRFDIPARTLDEAWTNFDEASRRGAANAEQQLRAEIAGIMRAQAERIAVPTAAQTRQLLDALGRPLGG